MWEQILIAVIIELVRRRVSEKGFSKGDFREIMRATENPPNTLKKLFKNFTMRRVFIRVLSETVEGFVEKLKLD